MSYSDVPQDTGPVHVILIIFPSPFLNVTEWPRATRFMIQSFIFSPISSSSPPTTTTPYKSSLAFTFSHPLQKSSFFLRKISLILRLSSHHEHRQYSTSPALHFFDIFLSSLLSRDNKNPFSFEKGLG